MSSSRLCSERARSEWPCLTGVNRFLFQTVWTGWLRGGKVFIFWHTLVKVWQENSIVAPFYNMFSHHFYILLHWRVCLFKNVCTALHYCLKSGQKSQSITSYHILAWPSIANVVTCTNLFHSFPVINSWNNHKYNHQFLAVSFLKT